MQINYLGDQIGAEILGVDVRSLSAQDFDIYQTWLRSGVSRSGISHNYQRVP